MSDLTGPATFEIKQFIKDKTLVEFHSINDKAFKGQIIWFDDNAFHIKLETGQELTIQRGAIVCYNKV